MRLLGQNPIMLLFSTFDFQHIWFWNDKPHVYISCTTFIRDSGVYVLLELTDITHWIWCQNKCWAYWRKTAKCSLPHAASHPFHHPLRFCSSNGFEQALSANGSPCCVTTWAPWMCTQKASAAFKRWKQAEERCWEHTHTHTAKREKAIIKRYWFAPLTLLHCLDVVGSRAGDFYFKTMDVAESHGIKVTEDPHSYYKEAITQLLH